MTRLPSASSRPLAAPAPRCPALSLIHIFWNANVITELTNGEVEAVGITIAQNEKGQGVPRVSEWLEAQENRRMERPDERVFMLLTEAESERLDDFLKKSGAQARCTRDGMTAYGIESQRIFFETAQAMDTP